MAQALGTGPLKNFYRSIARSEERHYELFLELARKYLEPDAIEALREAVEQEFAHKAQLIPLNMDAFNRGVKAAQAV